MRTLRNKKFCQWIQALYSQFQKLEQMVHYQKHLKFVEGGTRPGTRRLLILSGTAENMELNISN